MFDHFSLSGYGGRVLKKGTPTKSRKSAAAKPTWANRLARRLGRMLLSFMAILGGLITSLLLQAIFSGIARADDTPFFNYRLDPEDQTAIRAELDACGSDVDCYMRIIGTSRTTNPGASWHMRNAFEAALREMHPLIRGIATRECQRERQLGWILMTQCGRDKLFTMQEDVRQIQLARLGETPAGHALHSLSGVTALFRFLASRNHFASAIVAEACDTDRPTADCFDGNLAFLRDQLLRAHDSLAESFVQAVTLSSAVAFCGRNVGFGRCSVDRNWHDAAHMERDVDADAIAYAPARPLPGPRGVSPAWSRPRRTESASARRRAHRRTEEGSTRRRRRTSGGGNGSGRRTGDGTGHRAEGPRGTPAVTPPLEMPAEPVHGRPAEGGTPVVAPTGGRPPEETPTPAEAPTGVPAPGEAPDSIPANVPAGTPPQAGEVPLPPSEPIPEPPGEPVTPPAEVIPPAPIPPPPAPTPARPDRNREARNAANALLSDLENELTPGDACSPERMALYEQVIAQAASAGLGAVMIAESSRFSCDVAMNHPENLAARFLAAAVIRMAAVIDDPNQDAPEVVAWAYWFNTQLTALETQPCVAGPAELAAFHQYIQEEMARLLPSDPADLDSMALLAAAPGAVSILGGRSNPRTPLNQRFCAWRRAIETADPGSMTLFPRSVVTCRR